MKKTLEISFYFCWFRFPCELSWPINSIIHLFLILLPCVVCALPFDFTVHCLTWLYINQDLKRKKTHTHKHNKHIHTHTLHIFLNNKKKKENVYRLWEGATAEKNNNNNTQNVWAKGIKFCLLHTSYTQTSIVSSFVAESFHRQIKIEKSKRNEWEQQLVNEQMSQGMCATEWMGRGGGHRCEVNTRDAAIHLFIICQFRSSHARTHTHVYEIMLKAYFHIRYSEHSNQSAFHIFQIKLFPTQPTNQPTDRQTSQSIHSSTPWISATFNMLIE